MWPLNYMISRNRTESTLEPNSDKHTACGCARAIYYRSKEVKNHSTNWRALPLYKSCYSSCKPDIGKEEMTKEMRESELSADFFHLNRLRSQRLVESWRKGSPSKKKRPSLPPMPCTSDMYSTCIVHVYCNRWLQPIAYNGWWLV
jgi:hypothetical protein